MLTRNQTYLLFSVKSKVRRNDNILCITQRAKCIQSAVFDVLFNKRHSFARNTRNLVQETLINGNDIIVHFGGNFWLLKSDKIQVHSICSTGFCYTPHLFQLLSRWPLLSPQQNQSAAELQQRRCVHQMKGQRHATMAQPFAALAVSVVSRPPVLAGLLQETLPAQSTAGWRAPLISPASDGCNNSKNSRYSRQYFGNLQSMKQAEYLCRVEPLQHTVIAAYQRSTMLAHRCITASRQWGPDEHSSNALRPENSRMNSYHTSSDT
jgi:hypothetical protein